MHHRSSAQLLEIYKVDNERAKNLVFTPTIKTSLALVKLSNMTILEVGYCRDEWKCCRNSIKKGEPKIGQNNLDLLNSLTLVKFSDMILPKLGHHKLPHKY
jgi:hypothetical protein